VIDSDRVGRLAPFGDARTLAEGVRFFLSDPVRRRAAGEQGRASVLARYGLDRLLNDIDTLYLGL
jgi:glycosyltransferase involved in cell wall biosynthesis